MTTDLSELSARARRGELTASEQRQLRLLLASSLESRLAHLAGCEFDAEDSVLPGDEALAARLTERVLARENRTIVRQRHLAGRSAAVAVLVAAAAAAAAAAGGPVVVARLGTVSSALQPSAASTSEVPRAPSCPRTPSASAPSSPASETSLVPAAASSPASQRSDRAPARLSLSRGELPTASVVPPKKPVSDAAALFAAASRARRSGDGARAIGLYRELQEGYPSTAEAHAADIALGMLHASGAPRLALTHFRRYLDRGGPLAPEALWGQSEALSALGRTVEARQTWRLLIARYPHSTYAEAARNKLGAVE